MARNRLIVAGGAFIAALVLTPAAASAACSVNGGFPSITAAVSTLGAGAQVSFSGTCTENISISYDDVRITGSPTGTIEGELLVVGAQRFWLQNVTVTNAPVIGIFVSDGASATIAGVTVQHSLDSGIDVRHGSFARILDSHVHDNVWGLAINKGGVVDSYRNKFENNTEGQVDLGEHGTYRGSGDEIMQGVGAYAIWVDKNSYANLRDAPNFPNPRVQSAVTGLSYATNQSHLWTRDSTSFTGNINVDLQSSLDLAEQTSVIGNVSAQNLSVVQIRDDATVDGTVKCTRISICVQE